MSRRQPNPNARNANVPPSPDARRQQLCDILTEALEIARQLEDSNIAGMDASVSSAPEMNESSSSMFTIGDDTNNDNSMEPFAETLQSDEEAKQTSNSEDETTSHESDNSCPANPHRQPE